MYNPFRTNITSVERLRDGSWFYTLYSGNSAHNELLTEEQRLKAVLYNPAALKVFKLQCDMFSLVEICAYRNGRKLQNDALVNKLQHPNIYQTQRQFMWDYMFWTMLGTSYLYYSSKVLNDNTSLYFLDPSRFQWTDDILNKLDKNITSKQAYNDLMRISIQYYNLDGTYTTYQLKDIKPFFDLSNGVGNWFRGNSSIDALYKVISNSNKGLDAKGINLEYSGKYFISGQHKEDDIYGTPMGKDEKLSIERSLDKNKPVHATESMIDLKRFVDDIAKLELDEGQRADYFTIGLQYNIPKDVLEASLNGSTYENQEKASVRWVDQSLKPKAEDLILGLEKIYGYDNRNIDLTASWNHLGFMQVVEREKVALRTSKLNNLRMAQEMGILDEAQLLEQGREIMGIDE